MAFFDRVPVVDITRENLTTLWPLLQLSVKQSDFIGLDCELSGLGNRKLLNAPSIDERYQNISLAAKTRSIIAFGLSCFKLVRDLVEGDPVKRWHFRVHTFNVMVLCSEDYIVEPAALSFLVEHGFDFAKQYSNGVGYFRGNDRVDAEAPCHLRDLFNLLVTSQKSIIVHNGFVDLVFLYQNLYAQLPLTLAAFLADLSEMFPAGIYDTKYLADYVTRTSASYLEFLFRREQKANQKKATTGKPHIVLSFGPDVPSACDFIEYRECKFSSATDPILATMNGDTCRIVCDSYMHHGHCPQGKACPNSHDIDLILQKKEGKKRKKNNCNDESENFTKSIQLNDTEKQVSDKEQSTFGGHRAGFDAFMTGFTLATQLISLAKVPLDPKGFRPEDIGATELVNKIYLVSKDFPLLVQKSAFAKLSQGHATKYNSLFTN